MPAIQHLLQRLGFVKLSRYGLALSPDGRILSNRPAVLDDGAGNAVVGWLDGDFAVSELATWSPGCAPNGRFPPPKPSPRLVAPVEPRMIPAASQPSAAVMPAPVAAPPGVEDDDWEWTIALAKARASGETTAPVPRTRAQTSKTRPMPAVAVKDPATSGEWPATAPLGAIDYDSKPIVVAARATPVPERLARPRTAPPVAPPAKASPPPVTRRAQARTEPVLPQITPSTIIPVPRLPSVQGTQRLEPVVGSPRRFPKGTAQVGHSTATFTAMSEDTIPNLAIGDRTQVGVAMPPAARAVQLPRRAR